MLRGAKRLLDVDGRREGAACIQLPATILL
jgi:hypothetical protein